MIVTRGYGYQEQIVNFIGEDIEAHLENEDDFIGVLEGDDNFVAVLQQEQEEAEMEELDYVPEVYVALLGEPLSLLGELEEGGEFSGNLKDDE